MRRRNLLLSGLACGVLAIVSLALAWQPSNESLAVERRVTYSARRAGMPDKPVEQEMPNPHLRFTEQVKEAEDILNALQQTLLKGGNPRNELTRLRRSRLAIWRSARVVREEFARVRGWVQQEGLPQEILDRCDAAFQRHLETEQVVLDAIDLVLKSEQVRIHNSERYPTVLKPERFRQAIGFGLLERVEQTRNTLAGLKLRAAPDLYNSRPAVWQVQQPQAIPKADFEPNLPAVNVTALASAAPPVAGDLLPTVDVQITEEIIEEANQLGNSPSAIYEFVRNECEFQPYYGSRKGSVETLQQRSGNDYDLASLAIAMLRESGFEARYATGIVEIPIDRAESWLGVDDGDVAGSILTTMGLEGVTVVDGNDDPVAVRCRRVWVEAYVSRGRGGKVWVPLDPAFKLHNIHAGIDIPAEMGLDAQAFIDEYYEPSDPCVVLPRPETPLDLLIADINDYLAVYHPDETTESVKRYQEIEPEELGLLPASLPYKVLSRDSSFSEIPADKVYQIRFHLYDGGTTLIDETFDLPEIAGKRVTLSYIGATPVDQNIIDACDGLLNTPPYLVDVKPVLKIAGQTVAVGAASIGAGVTHSSNIHFLAPVNSYGLPQNMVPSIHNDIIAGEHQAVCFGVHGVTNPLAQPEDPCDTEGFIAQLRYASGIGYLSGCVAADEEFGKLLHCKVVTDVDDAILQDQVLVTNDMGGDPLSWEWKGLTVDADRKVIGVWKVDEYQPGCGGEAKDIMVLGGAGGSLYENLIFEDSVDKEAVSTIKILELAADQGITIYKRWNSTTLPTNTLPTNVRNAIIAAIYNDGNYGHSVTFSADQITHGNWTGCGYIDMDDCTGAAGYIISGGQNGGSTVVVWFDWLFVWSSKAIDYIEGKVTLPAHDSPDPGALYAKLGWFGLNPYMYFNYQLRPVFDDGSTGSWRNYTSPWYANLQFQFLPTGHYTVRVGDQGPDHERKVTIFSFEGKLTPQDNFSGRSQDKYGIEEIVDLTSTITPSDLTASQIGGLKWTIQSGVGGLSNVTNNGTATYDAKESAGNVALQLAIQSGPHAGKSKSSSKSVILPSGTRLTRRNNNVWHIHGYASAGISLYYWLDPKTVSFSNLDFGEGSCPSTNVSGFYLKCWPWNSYPNGNQIGGHAQNTFGAINPGNSTTGCRVVSYDQSSTGAANPFAAGSYTYVIPSEYIDDTGGRHSFGSQTKVGTYQANGNATNTKGGQSGSAALNDPSSGY